MGPSGCNNNQPHLEMAHQEEGDTVKLPTSFGVKEFRNALYYFENCVIKWLAKYENEATKSSGIV